MNIRFTQQEDAIIVDYLKKQNFKNIAQACRELSTILGKTAGTISSRYYFYLKQKEDIFYTTNQHGTLVNTKVVSKDKEPDFKPFQYIVKQILDLPREEREKVLNFFK